jgi:hypothetical protein
VATAPPALQNRLSRQICRAGDERGHRSGAEVGLKFALSQKEVKMSFRSQNPIG